MQDYFSIPVNISLNDYYKFNFLYYYIAKGVRRLFQQPLPPQFIPKHAFASQSGLEEFKAFIDSKLPLSSFPSPNKTGWKNLLISYIPMPFYRKKITNI